MLELYGVSIVEAKINYPYKQVLILLVYCNMKSSPANVLGFVKDTFHQHLIPVRLNFLRMLRYITFRTFNRNCYCSFG